jgi:hypothetical protein
MVFGWIRPALAWRLTSAAMEGKPMQRSIDSKIQAQVRILLARRWVDLRTVTVGTTNGVVYIGGVLGPSGGAGAPPGTSGSMRSKTWTDKLQREISDIPEVRDVVFQFEEAGSSGETCPPLL